MTSAVLGEKNENEWKAKEEVESFAQALLSSRHHSLAVFFQLNHFSNIISHSADETFSCASARRLLLGGCEEATWVVGSARESRGNKEEK